MSVCLSVCVCGRGKEKPHKNKYRETRWSLTEAVRKILERKSLSRILESSCAQGTGTS